MREETVENFRTDYAHNSVVRIVDFACHVSVAAILTYLFHLRWPWALVQWAPDICLLYMWPHGMITKRYLPEDSFILHVHRVLHRRPMPLMLLILGPFAISAGYHGVNIKHVLPLFFFVALNLFLHSTIDIFTHEGVRR